MNTNYIFSSGGNDSIALMRWVAKNKPKDKNYVIYSNTNWAIEWWADRVKRIKKYANSHNLEFVELFSEGMEAMVRRKKGWPMAASKMQFCTEELKVKPAREWMIKQDPEMDAICYTGIRREESQNRENAPAFIEMSERHGGRKLYCPLVEMLAPERNELVKEAGFEILPHSSMECFPCVNSNRSNFRLLAQYPDRVDYIANIEKEMGFTSKNNPRVMFRPYRHMGAIGIKAVIDWASCGKGKYKLPEWMRIFHDENNKKQIEEKIANMKGEIGDLQSFVDELELQNRLMSFDDFGEIKCTSGFCGL